MLWTADDGRRRRVDETPEERHRRTDAGIGLNRRSSNRLDLTRATTARDRWRLETVHLFAQADAARIPLPDQSVDLVFGSPPYTDARLYLEDGQDLGISRDTVPWVEWMLAVTTEALQGVPRACCLDCMGANQRPNLPACLRGAHVGVVSAALRFWRLPGRH